MFKKLFLCAVLFASNFTHADSIEVVTFRLKPDVSNKNFIASAKSMDKTLRSWKGFISRELVDVGNGEWIDIVHWENLESALKAEELALKSEICLPFFSNIDDSSQKLFRGKSALMQANKLSGKNN